MTATAVHYPPDNHAWKVEFDNIAIEMWRLCYEADSQRTSAAALTWIAFEQARPSRMVQRLNDACVMG
jgi:hypothetical protein